MNMKLPDSAEVLNGLAIIILCPDEDLPVVLRARIIARVGNQLIASCILSSLPEIVKGDQTNRKLIMEHPLKGARNLAVSVECQPQDCGCVVHGSVAVVVGMIVDGEPQDKWVRFCPTPYALTSVGEAPSE